MPRPESVGFFFPGQGAQYVGMGKDLADHFPSAHAIFEEADGILGYSNRQLCFEGPENELTRTLYAQPAIFVVSIAALAVLTEKFSDLKPAFAAGLSLGEFSALVSAGSLSFADGLRLVKKRAQAMEKSAREFPGAMASILGLSPKDCASVARETGCEVANLNAPDQIVLSGTEPAIEKACALAESRGAKRAIRLKVGGAFHSSLMRLAKDDLAEALRQTPIFKPRFTFIPNATAMPAQEPEEIRDLLARQLMSPVRWIETMGLASASGIPLFLEIGPGKVLKGLARKSAANLIVENCERCADFDRLEQLWINA